MLSDLATTLRVWAFLWLKHPEPVLVTAGIAQVLLGALLLWVTGRGRNGRMGRLAFAFWFGVASMALGGGQAIWLLYPQAVRQGVEWALVVADALISVSFGAVILWLGLARAQDAYGNAKRGWMALIPLANLVLAFRRSHPPQASGRRDLTPAVVVLFTMAFLARGLTTGIDEAVTTLVKRLKDDPQFQAMALRTTIDAYGLEPALDQEIALEGAPARFSDTLTLASVSRTGTALTYRFRVDEGPVTTLNAEYRNMATANWCKGLLPYLEHGATADMHYERMDGGEIETLHLSLTACTT